MFGLGAGEMLIILAFALIFIGPKKLPELARNLGKGLREFQKAKDDFMSHVESEKDDIKKAISEHDIHPEAEEHHPSLTGVDEASQTESPSTNDFKSEDTSHEISDEEVAAEANAIAEALKVAQAEEEVSDSVEEKEKPPQSKS
jgi:sec-independent protein translocase protein TatA